MCGAIVEGEILHRARVRSMKTNKTARHRKVRIAYWSKCSAVDTGESQGLGFDSCDLWQPWFDRAGSGHTEGRTSASPPRVYMVAEVTPNTIVPHGAWYQPTARELARKETTSPEWPVENTRTIGRLAW